MTIIAVDIDDTLYSFNDLAREVFVDVALEHGDKRLQRGAYCAWGEWRSPSDVTDADIWYEVCQICHRPDNVARQVPFKGAVETLHALADQGYGLQYTSNRSPDAYDATCEWLYGWDFPMADHTVICNHEDKLAQLRGCKYLIDDRPKTLVEFVYDFHWKHKHGSEATEMQRKAFGLFMPYNAALTDVPGIKLAPNWTLLRRYLVEQAVLNERTPVGTLGTPD